MVLAGVQSWMQTLCGMDTGLSACAFCCMDTAHADKVMSLSVVLVLRHNIMYYISYVWDDGTGANFQWPLTPEVHEELKAPNTP